MGAVERISARLGPGQDPASILLDAMAAAERFAVGNALPPAQAARLAVIAEELISNALRHGGADGGISFDLTLAAAADGICLTLTDDGPAFDPTADRPFAGPDPESGGGVGLALVRAWARDMAYCRESQFNRLSLTLPASA